MDFHIKDREDKSSDEATPQTGPEKKKGRVALPYWLQFIAVLLGVVLAKIIFGN